VSDVGDDVTRILVVDDDERPLVDLVLTI